MLAANAHSDVQAAEIQVEGAVAWGVQYHPEFSLADMAAIMRRYGARLMREGFFADAETRDAYIADLDALDRAPDDKPLAWRYGIDESVLDWRVRTDRDRQLDRASGAADHIRKGARMNYRDRHVVVTGGTGALGTAVVGALLEAGAVCHVPYRSEDEAQRFPHRGHKSVTLVALGDLADEAAVSALLWRHRQALGIDPYRGRICLRADREERQGAADGADRKQPRLRLSVQPRGGERIPPGRQRRPHRQRRGASGARAAQRREHDRLYGDARRGLRDLPRRSPRKSPRTAFW